MLKSTKKYAEFIQIFDHFAQPAGDLNQKPYFDYLFYFMT